MHTYTLSDGSVIPQMGFGTYQITGTEPILEAIRAGFRFFDTASLLSCMPQTTWLGEHPDFAIPKARTRF